MQNPARFSQNNTAARKLSIQALLEKWLKLPSIQERISPSKRVQILCSYQRNVATHETSDDDRSALLCDAILAIRSNLASALDPNEDVPPWDVSEELIDEFAHFVNLEDQDQQEGGMDQDRPRLDVDLTMATIRNACNDFDVDEHSVELITDFISIFGNVCNDNSGGSIQDIDICRVVVWLLILAASSRSDDMSTRIANLLRWLRSDQELVEILAGSSPGCTEAIRQAVNSPQLLDFSTSPASGAQGGIRPSQERPQGGRTASPRASSSSAREDAALCTICFETLNDAQFLVCGHSFHRNCVSRWLQRSPTCPLCKTPHSHVQTL